jgi:hypothetical protein
MPPDGTRQPRPANGSWPSFADDNLAGLKDCVTP